MILKTKILIGSFHGCTGLPTNPLSPSQTFDKVMLFINESGNKYIHHCEAWEVERIDSAYETLVNCDVYLVVYHESKD